MLKNNLGLYIKKNSYYFKTSWILNAKKDLNLKNGRVHLYRECEAEELSNLISKNNVFQRLRFSNQFYVNRARELANQTVIELYNGRDLEECARWVEKVSVFVFTLANHRDKLSKYLQITEETRTVIDLKIDRDCYYLSSSQKKVNVPEGLPIDKEFLSRYNRCSFRTLVNIFNVENQVSKRIKNSLEWLFQSRTEPLLESAIVKSAIALESLLIFSSNESLRRSLSHRVPIFLSIDRETRIEISKYIKKFYDARSAIVHGGRKKEKYIKPELLEGIDRIIILLNLILANNIERWDTNQKLTAWFKNEKFGEPDRTVEIPFSKSYVKNALRLLRKTS